MTPLPVLADAGLPMIVVEWPAMLLALLPVIGVEVLVARRMIHLPRGRMIAGIALANLISIRRISRVRARRA